MKNIFRRNKSIVLESPSGNQVKFRLNRQKSVPATVSGKTNFQIDIKHVPHEDFDLKKATWSEEGVKIPSLSNPVLHYDLSM